MSTPLTINSVETLQEALPLIRASQEAYSNFTQEQVDAICEKTAMAVSKMRIPLAKMACEETGYGIVVDKVTKNQYASEHIWNYMRNKKTCGIISEDRAFGVKKIASPKGVIAAITPTTNPTSTTIYKIMLALKTRNAIILSPHPHAVNCSIAAAKIMRDAAIEAGLPEHVISWISVPSLEISDVLMKSVDLIRRRLRHRHRQDHVDHVRASRGGLPGHGHHLPGYPQEDPFLPPDGQEGQAGLYPHHSRYRL